MPSKHQVNVPEGTYGNWAIKRFTVSKTEACMSALSGMNTGRCVPEGTYTGLYRTDRVFNSIIMSDTPDEIRDHMGIMQKGRGHVLVAGLGLGVVTQALLASEKVESLLVVEKSLDVIRLVGDYWQDIGQDRLQIVHADIHNVEAIMAVANVDPMKGFDAVWFDIWDTLNADNLDEMDELRDLWQPYIHEEAYVGCWSELQLKRHSRQYDDDFFEDDEW